jgi:hypothetical protein
VSLRLAGTDSATQARAEDSFSAFIACCLSFPAELSVTTFWSFLREFSPFRQALACRPHAGRTLGFYVILTGVHGLARRERHAAPW